MVYIIHKAYVRVNTESYTYSLMLLTYMVVHCASNTLCIYSSPLYFRFFVYSLQLWFYYFLSGFAYIVYYIF